MAEVMSMIPEENAPGELNADEQESLQVGEELEAQHDQMLAGKYKNAEELESAYLELQKKLGGDGEEVEEEVTEESDEPEPYNSDLFDRLWEGAANNEWSDEILDEVANADPAALAEMHLDYRRQVEQQRGPIMTEEDATALKGMIGGDDNYDVVGKAIISWRQLSLDHTSNGLREQDRISTKTRGHFTPVALSKNDIAV